MSEQTKFVLPTQKVAAVTSSPKNLIIFSKPKTGKTSLCAQLENNLILDLEQGSDFVSALKVNALSIEDIVTIGKAIIEAGRPYKYITIDTGTALEEMCVSRAEVLYSQSPMGGKWFTEGKLKYKSILNLPQGAGYPWLREAFVEVFNYIKTLAPRTILLCHVKDTVLDKEGGQFSSLDLDLTGRLKQIMTSKSDAVGYMYRKGGKNYVSFKTSADIACGARPVHLQNKEIEISEIGPEGNLISHWDRIFID